MCAGGAAFQRDSRNSMSFSSRLEEGENVGEVGNGKLLPGAIILHPVEAFLE